MDKGFQSTLPRRSDDGDTKPIRGSEIFQSTLPRRSDGNEAEDGQHQEISIHAPAKERLFSTGHQSVLGYFNPRSREGATVITFSDSCGSSISIHAPAKERHDIKQAITVGLVFQSTLPRRSDFFAISMPICIAISIHAPAKERHSPTGLRSHTINFNPRSREGATCNIFVQYVTV